MGVDILIFLCFLPWWLTSFVGIMYVLWYKMSHPRLSWRWVAWQSFGFAFWPILFTYSDLKRGATYEHQ